MKKLRVVAYAAGFVIALSASFAFKPNAKFNPIAYFKTPAPFCTSSTMLCNTGSVLCVVAGKQAYWDQGVCTIAATKQ